MAMILDWASLPGRKSTITTGKDRGAGRRRAVTATPRPGGALEAVCWSPVNDLQPTVARSADIAGLHATAPALLLELQSLLGALAATATDITDRGRRPFRPNADWSARLGQFAYRVYLLADQTGVGLETEVRNTAELVEQWAAQHTRDGEWPFSHD